MQPIDVLNFQMVAFFLTVTKNKRATSSISSRTVKNYYVALEVQTPLQKLNYYLFKLYLLVQDSLLFFIEI